MIRKIDVSSVYGRAQRTSYEYMKLLNEKYNNNYKVLIVDDKDGLHTLPFANHGANVVMYEPNKIYIEGGEIDSIKITPISNRKGYESNKKQIKIVNKNFYETKVEDRYEFVYCYRSLHERHNKDIPLKRKVRKLLSSVKEGGYVYIFYHLAKNEKDISNYPRNQYLRRNEMISYFNPKIWKVITIIEHEEATFHNGHPKHKNNHKHIVGHIFAQKKNNRLVHKSYYDIIGLCDN